MRSVYCTRLLFSVALLNLSTRTWKRMKEADKVYCTVQFSHYQNEILVTNLLINTDIATFFLNVFLSCFCNARAGSYMRESKGGCQSGFIIGKDLNLIL